ncbi:MAG: winged helix-turn-helix transcriptional regulator [Sulfolobales archaeon]
MRPRAPLLLLFLYILEIMLSSIYVAGDYMDQVDVAVRIEPPLVKYYINISSDGSPISIAISIQEGQLICTASPEVRLQLISSSRYLAMLQGRGLVVCASTNIEITNGSLYATVYPIIVNGSAYNISEIWLPYYLVNTASTPNPAEVLPAQDSGYILRFGVNETIYIKARIFPYPRELMREASTPINPAQNSYVASNQEPTTQILLYMGIGLLGGVIGYASPRIARIMRSRIARRDLDKEIIDLLSKNPKGMSLSLISKTLNTPKSTTWKRLKRLVEEGLVEEFEGHGKGKLYRLKKKET